jgi:CHAT domain-containing protein
MRRSRIAPAVLVLCSLCLCVRPAAQSDSEELINQDHAKIVQAEKEHGPQSKELADALFAFLHHRLDLSARFTIEYQEMARRLAEVTAIAYGENSPERLDALLIQTDVENEDLARSQTIALQALDLARHLNPPDPHGLSQAARALGDICEDLGDWECALSSYDEAINAERTAEKTIPRQLAKALNNRAYLYAQLGRNEEAYADYRLVYGMVESAIGREDARFGYVSINLGTSLVTLGRPEEAIPYLEQAIKVLEKANGPGNYRTAMARATLARAWAGEGKFDQALPLMQEAVDAYRSDFYKEHYLIAKVLRQQALVLAQAGELPKAVEVGLETERISREQFLLAAAALPERQALNYASSRERGLDVALSVLAAAPGLDSSAVYEQVIRSRSLVADGIAWRNQEAAQSSDPDVQALLQDLNQRRTRLAELAAATSPSDSSSAATLSTARAEFEQAEVKLAERNRPFQREWQERRVSLQQVNDGLPQGTVLISYVRYRQYAVRRADPREDSTENYAAFVKKQGELPRFISLGAAKPVDDLVVSLRTLIEQESDAPGISPATSLQNYEKIGAKLRRAIWDPLLVGSPDKDKDTKMYLLVPDGMLHFVNVAALPARTGGYLIEHVAAIHRLTSERDLLAGSPPPSSGMVAVGAVDSGGGTSAKPARRGLKLSCSDISKANFPALPATAREVQDVADLYRESNAGAPVFELTGNKASKQEFLSKAGAQSILHLATHAYFLPAACSAQAGASSQRVESSAVPSENPLLRAGLVFAGQTTERLLTAQEISGLSLSNSRWAVLSACDSGIGDVQDGEGVLGLQRAFRVAGVRTVIISLWPVDDDSTRRFMDNLYRARFRMNHSTADAVQEATLQSLRQLRAEKRSTHPFYWAGFVASGDWR